MGAPQARGSNASVITSTKNERIRRMRRLHRARHRREEGLTLVEGPEPVAAALEAAADVRWICVHADDVAGIELARSSGVDSIVVSDAVLRAAAPTSAPRGPIAVVGIPPPKPLRRHDTLVLWDITDPGNVGTLIRSAAAFGFDVATTAGSADVWGPKVIRAAAGAHFAVSAIARLGEDPLGELRDAGVAAVATLPTGGSGPAGVPTAPIALLIGNEARGLPGEVGDSAEWSLTLAMPGNAESLNAAIAGSIAMYLLADRAADPSAAEAEDRQH